jgi:hypothetical protein
LAAVRFEVFQNRPVAVVALRGRDRRRWFRCEASRSTRRTEEVEHAEARGYSIPVGRFLTATDL